jgi:hypothetical protein
MADTKYTARMALTDLINDKNIDKVKEWAKGEIDKLDKKNAKRKTAEGEIKAENKEIAQAILNALANGSMPSTDLAKTIGQSVPKTNGVAGEMVKLGMLTKTKVKVKGKGDQTSYSLVVVDTPTADEDKVADTDEVAEDTAD